MKTTDLFEAQLSAWGLDVYPKVLDSLTAYATILAGYRRANVIGTKDPERVLLDHVLDSLGCLLFPPTREVDRLADVGSGGGLPGIPMRVSLPSARVVLFESTGKKVDFLRTTVRQLRLDGTDVIRGRVEEAGREEPHRSQYDLCTARAVARLSVIAEYCVPLTRIGGHVIAMKGRPDHNELEEGTRAAEALGARVREVIEVPMLPEIGDKERRLVVLQKILPTPGLYPRNPGTPTKSPLGSR